MGRISPVKLTEPAYVLEVAIQRQSVAVGDDRQAALRPDMLLTATIEVENRKNPIFQGAKCLSRQKLVYFPAQN